MKHAYSISPKFIIQYFNWICIHIKTQKQIYIFTIFVLIYITAGLKSTMYICLSKIMLKSSITKSKLQIHKIVYFILQLETSLFFLKFINTN